MIRSVLLALPDHSLDWISQRFVDRGLSPRTVLIGRIVQSKIRIVDSENGASYRAVSRFYPLDFHLNTSGSWNSR